MPFDPTLPATGVTTFGNLYAILREQFVSEAWITLTPANYWEGATNPLHYMKDPMGFVHFRGHFQATSDQATSFPFNAVLPLGYRPEIDVYFPNVLVSSTQTMYYSRITTGGDLVYDKRGANDSVLNDSVLMDGVTYKAAVV